MDANLIAIAVSGLISAGGSWYASTLAFRIRFERFEAAYEKREENWNKWREGIEADAKDKAIRLGYLERHIVTRNELDAAIEQMRAERRNMHEENREHLDRIESKIDAAKDAAFKVATQVAVLSRGLPPRDEG